MELGFIELYNHRIHGNNRTKKLDNLLLVNNTITLDEFYSNEYIALARLLMQKYRDLSHYLYNVDNNITGYIKIVRKLNIHSVRLIEPYFTDSNEEMTIDKTYLIKIFQKKWRNILKERKRIIRLRCNPRELFYKQVNGKWSKQCNRYV